MIDRKGNIQEMGFKQYAQQERGPFAFFHPSEVLIRVFPRESAAERAFQTDHRISFKIRLMSAFLSDCFSSP
ncbi:MAG: hypothetical protein CMP07_12040 [Xanthomonadales bacterium]|nr:hypothetical protein [Xanthomonadales bacterium]|tara:strand:+ start:59 stop:274 length:216 start_codon:yes stop_codon:yes gene_type:complete